MRLLLTLLLLSASAGLLASCDSESPEPEPDTLTIPATTEENRVAYRLDSTRYNVRVSPSVRIDAVEREIPRGGGEIIRQTQVSIRRTLRDLGTTREYETLSFSVFELSGPGTHTVTFDGEGGTTEGSARLSRTRCPNNGLCDFLAQFGMRDEWTLNVVRYDETGLAAEFAFVLENREGELLAVEAGEVEVRFDPLVPANAQVEY